MSNSHDNETNLKYTLPTTGYIFEEDVSRYVLCKPKLMPMKSITLVKLEKMQKEAEEKLKSHMNSKCEK